MYRKISGIEKFYASERGAITFLRRKLLSHSTEKFRWRPVRCFRKFRVSQNFLHKKGISLNSWEIFCLRVPIKFVGEHFCVSKEFWYRKFSSKGGGKLHGFVEIFLSHSTGKTSPGNHSVFQKISGREKIFMVKRMRVEVSQFSVEKFLSHCTKIFHWRTLWCFRNFFNRNFSSIGGGHHAFGEFFLSHRTETKSVVKEPFCFPEIFWYRKIFWIRGGISRFSVEIFMSHSAEKFRKGILLFFRKFVVSKSLMNEKRGYHVFPSKIFGLTVPKNSVGIPSMFQKVWGIEKFYA